MPGPGQCFRLVRPLDLTIARSAICPSLLNPSRSQVDEKKTYHPLGNRSLGDSGMFTVVTLSEKGCDPKLRFNDVYVTEQWNDHVMLKVCYAYTGEGHLSAITYQDGINTGKWSYQAASISPGIRCTKMRVSKSSTFAYTSDAIRLALSKTGCAAMYRLEKYWSDGTDQKRSHH